MSGDLVMAVLAIAFALYVYNDGSQYLQAVVIDGITVMVLACSWNVISGFTGYFSFGQVAFYGIGGYATAELMVKTQLSFPLAIALAAIVSMTAAVPLGWVLLRLRGIYFALGTLALYVAFTAVATNTQWLGRGQGLSVPLTASSNTILLSALAIGAIAIATVFALSRARLGLRAQALSADESAIKTLGVRTMGVKLSMFVISAGLAGLAGAVAALNAGFLTPETAFSAIANMQSIVYTLIGGVGTVWGPVLGTGIAEAIVTRFGPSAATEVQIALGLLIVVIVTLTPSGIIGLLNRVGILRRRVMLRKRHANRLVVAPGWLRRYPPDDHAADRGVLLECNAVTVRYSGATAVDAVDLRVDDCEFVAIIGANGAGKTTLFNAISGYVKRAQGSVKLAGRDVSALDATELARAGITRTFQIPRLAERLTVWENVLLGSLLCSGLRAAQERAALIIREIGLEDFMFCAVEQLGPGIRRRVEIARVVATRPRVILLDEALAGMSSEEIEEVRKAISALREWGVDAIVSVEHVLSAVRDLADRMIAMDFGHIVVEGLPDYVLEHEAVVNSYLGGAAGGGEVDAKPALRRVHRAPQAEPLMEVVHLAAGYGQVRVLWDVGMYLGPGEFVGVLGASGAGKTTLCRALTGGCTVHSGSVRFGSEEIIGRPAHRVARMGVAHVPSSRELFLGMSVQDNLRLGAVAWGGPDTRRLLGMVQELFPELRPLISRRAGALSGGQQQIVAIGRALMREPSFLVLDEPSTGLAPVVVGRLMGTLRSLADNGVAIMVAEQNAAETLRAVDRAYVLQEGRIVFSGTSEDLRDEPRLAKAYLGADAGAPSDLISLAPPEIDARQP
ncbi:MAG: ATP-binding cassette domain-containing protein [Solirubrobacteraceae bacterium]